VRHEGQPLDDQQAEQEGLRHIEAWRNRPIEGDYPYVYLDGIVLKRS
jgi:transposase-like protein